MYLARFGGNINLMKSAIRNGGTAMWELRKLIYLSSGPLWVASHKTNYQSLVNKHINDLLTWPSIPYQTISLNFSHGREGHKIARDEQVEVVNGTIQDLAGPNPAFSHIQQVSELTEYFNEFTKTTLSEIGYSNSGGTSTLPDERETIWKMARYLNESHFWEPQNITSQPENTFFHTWTKEPLNEELLGLISKGEKFITEYVNFEILHIPGATSISPPKKIPILKIHTIEPPKKIPRKPQRRTKLKKAKIDLKSSPEK